MSNNKDQLPLGGMYTGHTRTELASSIEDAPKHKALATLKRLGVIMPYDAVETYHGRARHMNDNSLWEVQDDFNNGGNNTFNRNVNKCPALYTGSVEVAREFAEARALKRTYDDTNYCVADVHEIVTRRNDAYILNSKFDEYDLSKDQYRNEYIPALRALVIDITDGSPVGRDEKHAYDIVFDYIHRKQMKLVDLHAISDMVDETNVCRDTAMQIASAYNARQVSLARPGYLINLLCKAEGSIMVDGVEVDGEWQRIPFSTEYVHRYMKNANIVGIESYVYSGTLNGKRIRIASLLNLSEVQDKQCVERTKLERAKTFGSISNQLLAIERTDSQERVNTVLENPYARPENIVKAAMEVRGFQGVFDASAGNWEGYTLGEHTETVLRNFEENYADDLNVEMLKTMRTAIIVHDIGKSLAVKHGNKYERAKYNMLLGTDFLDKIGTDERQKKLILGLVSGGLHQAARVQMNDTPQTQREMYGFAQNQIREVFGAKATSDMVRGYIEMAHILQECKAAAYTAMAVTRDSKTGYFSRNNDVFKSAFGPKGLDKRSIKRIDTLSGGTPSRRLNDFTPKLDSNSFIKRYNEGCHGGTAFNPPRV